MVYRTFSDNFIWISVVHSKHYIKNNIARTKHHLHDVFQRITFNSFRKNLYHRVYSRTFGPTCFQIYNINWFWIIFKNKNRFGFATRVGAENGSNMVQYVDDPAYMKNISLQSINRRRSRYWSKIIKTGLEEQKFQSIETN